MPNTILSVINLNDDQKHIIMVEDYKTINEVKFVLAKRILTTPDNITLYKTKDMNDVYCANEIVANKKLLYMYVDYYEPPKKYSWFRYYFCCGR